jgi:hypothetical protein
MLAVLLVLALLIGGLTQISRQSHAYDVGANRSLAAQGGVLADQSNATAEQVRHLMADMPTQERGTLQADLDGVVRDAATQLTGMTRAAAGPTGTLGTQLVRVFSDRSRASTMLRGAVDGLLGMHPLPVTGAPGADSTVPATPGPISATEAATQISAAGTLLQRADRDYRAVQRRLARAPGHARLPSSVWVTDAQIWQAGAVTDQVDQMASSSSLEAVHELKLRSIRLTPPALPTTTPPPADTSVLTPTSTVEISVVLSNQGNVDERRAAVTFSLAPQGPGASHATVRRTFVAAGTSVALDPVIFDVKAGHTYQLRIAIALPAGQSDTGGTTLTEILDIAPGT